MSKPLHAAIEAIGLLGPGLDDWEQARPVLAGLAARHAAATRVPLPDSLPPAERRRCGLATKTALAVAQQALKSAAEAGRPVASVFTSSGGDAVNCHEICAALASADPGDLADPLPQFGAQRRLRLLEHFHRRDAAALTVLCAHDGSFAAGLLEALAQVGEDAQPVLLLAYDTRYPEPLFGLRPIPDAFGVALLLTPATRTAGIPRITLDPATGLTDGPADTCTDPQKQQLRGAIPAARSLPLLCALARGETRDITLDYLDGLRLRIGVEAG